MWLEWATQCVPATGVGANQGTSPFPDIASSSPRREQLNRRSLRRLPVCEFRTSGLFGGERACPKLRPPGRREATNCGQSIGRPNMFHRWFPKIDFAKASPSASLLDCV